ncbi:hypothetical protein [Streptomyces sp. DT203]|uniref:hypothetical protein n=1 Tax=Streptomyces sp. DT203 TaxID=3393424 RepID=UPI003CEEB6CB
MPTTLKSGWVSSRAAKPVRTTWWSSATTIRTAGCGSVLGVLAGWAVAALLGGGPALGLRDA